MHPTFHTSVKSSRYFPSTVSPPLLLCTKTSGRGTPAGLVHPRGRLSTWASTSVRSKRAARHGCAACVEVATQRPSADCGRADTRSSQPRRWRESPSSSSLYPCRLHCRARPLGRASGPAICSRRSSACAMACRYSASCKTRFWTCGRRSPAPSVTSMVCSVSRCVPVSVPPLPVRSRPFLGQYMRTDDERAPPRIC